MNPNTRILMLACFLLNACGGGSSRSAAVSLPPPPPAIIEFNCTNDANCPSKGVINDPPAEFNGAPAGFRGYTDPDLEYDPMTGTLWLSYSWVNFIDSDPGPGITIQRGVRTHLARSDDRGETFHFVREVNSVVLEAQPDTGEIGYIRNEVSTLTKTPGNSWQLLWLKFLELPGDPHEGTLYWRTMADSPEELGNVSEVWIRGANTSASYGAPINLSDMPELSNCSRFTEPDLFVWQNDQYLLSSCVVIDENNVRLTNQERLVLLRENGAGYSFVANVTDGLDATDLGGNRLEQADISTTRNGTVILIVTPLLDTGMPQHQGCYVLEFENFATGELVRDANGNVIPRVFITANESNVRPGACTYDPQSDTGIIQVMINYPTTPTNAVFSLRTTGIHP